MSRFRRPIYWGKDAPESPFGIHEEPILPLLTGLKAGGINWVRLHDGGFQYCKWPAIEEKREMDPFTLQKSKAYRDAGMMLYGQLGGAPTWASYYANSEFKPDGYRKFFSAPTDEHLGDFENYAYQIVKHHEKEIQDWFVWNEPWGGGFFHCGYDTERQCYLPFKNQGAAYAKVLKAAYLGAKRANPNVRITGFATYGSATEFTTQIVEAGGYEYCDELDITNNSPTFGSRATENLQNSNRVRARHGKNTVPFEKNHMSEGKSAQQRIRTAVCRSRDLREFSLGRIRFLQSRRSTRSRCRCYVPAQTRFSLIRLRTHGNLTKSSFSFFSARTVPAPHVPALSNGGIPRKFSFRGYQELCRTFYAAVFQKNVDGSPLLRSLRESVQGRRAEIHCTAKNAHQRTFKRKSSTWSRLTYNGYFELRDDRRLCRRFDSRTFRQNHPAGTLNEPRQTT